MDLQNIYIPELQYEVMLTEKFFNRIPMDKFNWRPHPKSMSIKELSNHLAEIPGYVTAIMEKDEMDIANYKAPQLENREELIKLLRENASRAEVALRKPNEEYEKIWKMVHGEKNW